MSEGIPLSGLTIAVLYDHEGYWVARCVECGVITTGDTALKALENLPDAIDITLKDWVAAGRPASQLFNQKE